MSQTLFSQILQNCVTLPVVRIEVVADMIRYDRYDITILTCARKRTSSLLSLPLEIVNKTNIKLTNYSSVSLSFVISALLCYGPCCLK